MSVVRPWGAALVLRAGAAVAQAQAPAPAPPATKPAPPAPAAPAPPAPAPEYKVVTTEPVHAVVLPMKGSYAQHQEAFERLGAYLAGRGISPTGAPFGRYFSDPAVGEANLVWEVGFDVPAGVKVEPPFEVKEIPASLSVIHVHRGSYDDLASAWPKLVQWVSANGYQVAGPATQVYKDFMAPEIELRMTVQK